MFGRKFQIVTQVVGTITLAFLAVYGLLALIENSAAAWAQAPEVADVPSSVPSLESSEVSMSVPLVMNYQGDVKDAEGNALDGSYNMTFRIYSDLVVGTALWEEQHQNVTVRRGHFSVLLGNTTPLPETLFDEPDRFIGITVDPYQEMVPRQRFASVPYAMYANDATNAANADHASQADNASQAVRAFGLSAEDGSSQDAVIVDAEGNVGIGTTELGAKLNVNGAIEYQAIKQVDLATPTTYQIKATRYYVEATKDQVRNTVPLDMEVVNELCKDEDGCAITLGMKDWHDSRPGTIASRGPYRFFMSETSNWWRLSNTDKQDLDGDGAIHGDHNRILKVFDCYFMDAEYSNGSGTDNSVQLGLLNWNDTYNDPDMVCVLIIDD